jgi:hypothetical protein
MLTPESCVLGCVVDLESIEFTRGALRKGLPQAYLKLMPRIIKDDSYLYGADLVGMSNPMSSIEPLLLRTRNSKYTALARFRQSHAQSLTRMRSD